MKKLILLILCCFGLTVTYAQQVRTIKKLGAQSIAPAALISRLQHILDSGKVTGLQVAIINNKHTVWTHSFGLKNVEEQVPLNDSTVMYAASITKVVFGYLFLRLVDQGIFDLDQPIHRYLKLPIAEYPKWKDLAADTISFNQITARMLLSHSSGLPVLRSLYGDKLYLISKPAEKFYYSNEGMNLLGFVVEEYTGKGLDVLARAEVFAPLHMNHTSMIWEPEFGKNFSFAYYKDGKKYGSERRTSSRAAGSMSTTAVDYAKFVSHLMNKKGLSKQSYEEMFSAQIFIHTKRGFGPGKDSLSTENDKIKLSRGLGPGLFESPYGPAFFHGGHGEANQNYFVAFPKKGISVVLMSNSENFESVSDAILEACIADHYSPLTWLGHFDH